MLSVPEAADDTHLEADGFLLMDKRLERDALQVVDPGFVHALKRKISEVKQRDPIDAMCSIAYKEITLDPDYDMDAFDDTTAMEEDGRTETARRGACRGSRGGSRGVVKYRSALVQMQRRGSVHIHTQPPEEEGLLAGLRRHADEMAVIQKLRGGASFRSKARGRPRGRGRGRGAAAPRPLKNVKALSPPRPGATRPHQAEATAGTPVPASSASRNMARRGSGTARRGSGPPLHREPAMTPSRARPDKNLILVEEAVVTLGETVSPPLVKVDETEPVAPPWDPPSEEDGIEDTWPCSSTMADGQVLSEHNYLTNKPPSLSEPSVERAEASDDEDEVVAVKDSTGKTKYYHKTSEKVDVDNENADVDNENVDVDVENDDETLPQVEPSTQAPAPASVTTVASTAASLSPSTTATSTTSTAVCTTIPAAMPSEASSPASGESSIVVSAATSIPAAPRAASPASTAAPTSAPLVLELSDEHLSESRRRPGDSATTATAMQLARRSPDACSERPGTKPATLWQKCQLCGAETFSLEEFRHHMLTLHMNAQPYKCMECWKKFATAKDLIRHTDNNCKATFYKCQRCDRTWSSDVHHAECQICEDAGGEKGQEASLYGCALCDSSYPRLRHLSAHLKTHSNTAKAYKCSPCGLLFSTSVKLMLHAKNHSPSKAGKRTAQQSPPVSPAGRESPDSSASSEGSPEAKPFDGVAPSASTFVPVGPPFIPSPTFAPLPGTVVSPLNLRFPGQPRAHSFAPPLNFPPTPKHFPQNGHANGLANGHANGHARHQPRGVKPELPSDDEMDDDLDDEGDDIPGDADDSGQSDDEWRIDIQDNSVTEKKVDDDKGDGSDDDDMEVDEGKELEDASRIDAEEQSNLVRCPWCPKTFRHSSAAEVHKRTHTGEKPFHCFLCPKTFTAANNLKRHLISVHKFDSEEAGHAHHSMLARNRKRVHRERFRKLSDFFARQGGMKSFGPTAPASLVRRGLKHGTRGRRASHASHASPSQRSPTKSMDMLEAAQGMLQLKAQYLLPLAEEEGKPQHQQQQQPQQQQSGPVPQLHKEQPPGQQQQLPRPAQPLQPQSAQPQPVQPQQVQSPQPVQLQELQSQPQELQPPWHVQLQQIKSKQLHSPQPSTQPVQPQLQPSRPVQPPQRQHSHMSDQQLDQLPLVRLVQCQQVLPPQPSSQRAQPQPKGRGRGRGRGSGRGRVGLGTPNFKQSSPIVSPTSGTVIVQSRPIPHSVD